MEVLVVLGIIYLVVRMLSKNSKAHKERQEARRLGTPYAPSPRPAPGDSPQTAPRPQGLRDLLDTLQRMSNPGDPVPMPLPQTAPPAKPEASGEGRSLWETRPPHVQATPLTGSRLMESGLTEGCLEEAEDCEAPHAALPSRRPMNDEDPELVPALQELPEVAKAVIYAEILARTKVRRRLRP